MRVLLKPGRRCSPLLLAMALVWGLATTDASGSWGPEFNISGGEVNETYTSANNQRFAAVDDSNNLYIAFYDNRNKTGSDNNFEIYFRRFVYNFGSPTITRVTDFYNQSKFPSIATLNWGAGHAGTVNDSGRVYITWQDARLYSIPVSGDPKSFSIYLRTFMSRGGAGFGPEIQVSAYDSLNAASSPVLACGDSSRVWLVWQKVSSAIGTTNLFYATYNSLARTITPEQMLVAGAPTANNPSIAATKDGVVHLVWSDNRTGRTQIWTKRFVPGSGWTAETQAVFSPNVATNPSLTATTTGHLHLVWRDNRDGNNEVYYKEYVPGVGWDPNPANDMRLTTHAASQIQPQCDADPVNNVYVVWQDQRKGASNPDIFFRERQGGVWQPELALVTAPSDSNQIQELPGVTHDGVNNIYATWTDQRLPASQGRNSDVYYKVGMDLVTSVEPSGAPRVSRVFRSFPNPFNPATRIEYRVERDAHVLLRVFDSRGRLVRTLVDAVVPAGIRSVVWDGVDDHGRPMGSGTYYLRLQGGGSDVSRKVNLLK